MYCKEKGASIHYTLYFTLTIINFKYGCGNQQLLTGLQ